MRWQSRRWPRCWPRCQLRRQWRCRLRRQWKCQLRRQWICQWTCQPRCQSRCQPRCQSRYPSQYQSRYPSQCQSRWWHQWPQAVQHPKLRIGQAVRGWGSQWLGALWNPQILAEPWMAREWNRCSEEERLERHPCCFRRQAWVSRVSRSHRTEKSKALRQSCPGCQQRAWREPSSWNQLQGSGEPSS